MNSNNPLLCIFALVVVFGCGTLAYKSGCSDGYCFVISDYTNSRELLDLSNAQQRCRSIGSNLVEIRNKDIQKSLVDFTKSVYPQGLNGLNILTNAKLSTGSKKWRRLSGRVIGNLTVNTINGQADSSVAYGYLERTTSGFDLFATRATYNKGFICTGLTDCSGGVTISGQCYKSFTETMSWYDARNRCLDAGGDLASFEDITSNDEFNALNGSWISPSSSYWIGIRRESWRWQSTDSEVKYTEWLSGHPRNYVSCLCLSSKYWQWTECDCDQPLPYVCMLETSTTSTSPRTSATMTIRPNKKSTPLSSLIKSLS